MLAVCHHILDPEESKGQYAGEENRNRLMFSSVSREGGYFDRCAPQRVPAWGKGGGGAAVCIHNTVSCYKNTTSCLTAGRDFLIFCSSYIQLLGI